MNRKEEISNGIGKPLSHVDYTLGWISSGWASIRAPLGNLWFGLGYYILNQPMGQVWVGFLPRN